MRFQIPGETCCYFIPFKISCPLLNINTLRLSKKKVNEQTLFFLFFFYEIYTFFIFVFFYVHIPNGHQDSQFSLWVNCYKLICNSEQIRYNFSVFAYNMIIFSVQCNIFMAESSSIPAAIDENMVDYIFNYGGSHNLLDTLRDLYPITILNELYAVVHVPRENAMLFPDNTHGYASIPKCFGPADFQSLQASGILTLQNQPFIPLRGKDVAVAIIDDGIDFTNPLFLNPDNTTRIAYYWDQSNTLAPPFGFSYGTSYTSTEINQMLLEREGNTSASPSSSHGTVVAGVAAGNTVEPLLFSGAAPESTLIVVKLKQAKKYLRDFFLIPDGVPCYQENDIIAALEYIRECSRRLNDIPVSICIPLQSSCGSHTGALALSVSCDLFSKLHSFCICLPSGNEGNSRHHYHADLSPNNVSETIEIFTLGGELGFSAELWSENFTDFSLQILSPSGETREIHFQPPYSSRTVTFVFLNTIIYLDYFFIENQSGRQLIYLRFLKPAPGLWSISIRNVNPQPIPLDMWLPITSFLESETYFLSPDPNITVTAPGDCSNAITVASYDYRTESLAVTSGRGYTADNKIVPTIAAPGVNIFVPVSSIYNVSENTSLSAGAKIPPGELFSGTSIAAAQCCGAAALFLQWAIINNNLIFVNGIGVKNYLLRGAIMPASYETPNPLWGYGKLDLYNTLRRLSGLT